MVWCIARRERLGGRSCPSSEQTACLLLKVKVDFSPLQVSRGAIALRDETGSRCACKCNADTAHATVSEKRTALRHCAPILMLGHGKAPIRGESQLASPETGLQAVVARVGRSRTMCRP